MSIEVLRPNAAGDETGLDSQFPSGDNHWDKVDEEEADDSTTYVYDRQGGYRRDLYNLPASSGSGTINKITVYFRCLGEDKTLNYAKASIKSDSTVTDGDVKTFAANNTWETFTQEWATNPADSQAWEWADIDALQIGVSIIYGGSGIDTLCTQVYVEVDYTTITDYPISISVGLTASPSIDRDLAYKRATSTDLSLAPTVARTVTFTRATTNALSMLASVAVAKGRTFTVNVALSVSSTVSRAITYTRDTTSGLTLAPTISRVLAATRATVSNLSLATTITRTADYVRDITSNLSLTTTVSKVVAFARATATNLSLAPTVVRSWAANRATTVNLSLAPTVSRVMGYTKVITVNLSLQVVIEFFKNRIKLFAKKRNLILHAQTRDIELNAQKRHLTLHVGDRE